MGTIHHMRRLLVRWNTYPPRREHTGCWHAGRRHASLPHTAHTMQIAVAHTSPRHRLRTQLRRDLRCGCPQDKRHMQLLGLRRGRKFLESMTCTV